MPPADKQQTEKQEANEASIERESASGNKMWGVYISEAKKYDDGLIEGWRSEMDGLLIFAGLFSGVVTTFIIDSYKTLNPDSGSQTIVLLTQISRQLANLNNGTAVTDALPPPAAFSPPLSALICNALWFASLGLSLSSALVATLVEQWAREYQHRTTMFPTIFTQSRVYMYLYYGLRRFKMHVVVGIPPLLLHMALVLFFAGLVAFLLPINIIITGISSALLLLFVLVYVTFTVLPLLFSDSPFQTPLSRTLWPLSQSLGNRLRAHIPNKVAVTDPEAPAKSSGTRLRTQSMLGAMKSAAQEITVQTQIRALAWAVRSLSNDVEFEPFVEGLSQALWDFERGKPCTMYREHFKGLLQTTEVGLCQRLADFIAGSMSNLLEDNVRLRRQISVLRAICAICAFSLHTETPLQSPIGDADLGKALASSRFLGSTDVQSMVPAVSALIGLNVIEFKRRKLIPTQGGISGRDPHAEAKTQLQKEKQQMYMEYLNALSKSPANFQRELTNSFFHQSQVPFQTTDNDFTLTFALEELIRSESDGAADNLVFAVRQMIRMNAEAWKDERVPWISGLAPFLIRNPSLAAYDLDSSVQPGPKSKYSRLLCYSLSMNLYQQLDLQASVDSLQLIYRHFLNETGLTRHPEDLRTHFYVFRTLRSSGVQAADIHTHRLVAIIQSVMLKCFRQDSSEWAKWLSIFDDEDWFRAVIGLDDEKRMERISAKEARDLTLSCARAGVLTTFFEQCARIPDQTERELDFETFNSVSSPTDIDPVLPTEIQCRFADAVTGFLHKYTKDSLAEKNELASMLRSAVDADDGWIQDPDALQVLDTAVSDVQTDYEQQTHRNNAEEIRKKILARLLPEDIFAAFVSLVTGGD